MTANRVFRLVHETARSRAIEAIKSAPDGWVVTIKEPTRNLDQNALLWALLDRFSRHLLWPVNGQMEALTPEEWKDLLSAAFNQESPRVAPGINGGMVLLGERTSRYSVRRFAEFIEFIHSVASDRGLDLEH